MARPTLWRFGDAANLYPGRETIPTLNEWMRCLLLVREEMEYDLLGEEPGAFKACADESEAEINRFAGDWVALHLLSSMRVLAAQQESTHAFLKNGGIAWAQSVRHMKPTWRPQPG